MYKQSHEKLNTQKKNLLARFNGLMSVDVAFIRMGRPV